MRLKKENGEHEVTITVTIAKASFTDYAFDPKKTDTPQNYLHCQYRLLPDDRDLVKVDVVSFGAVAKLYSENETKVIRTWTDGSRSWVTWKNSRKIRITKEKLLRIFKHKLDLKVWDTKDKISARARFDRPKNLKASAKTSGEPDINFIKHLLSQEEKIKNNLAPPSSLKARIDDDSNENSSINFANAKLGEKPLSGVHFIQTSGSKLDVQVCLNKYEQPEFSTLISLARSGARPLCVDTLESKPQPAAKHQALKKINSDLGKIVGTTTAPKLLKKRSRDKIHHRGVANISIPLSSLFTNSQMVSNRLREPVSTLEEVIVIVSLDKGLLSEEQRQALNPLVITVATASPMPSNTLDYEQLRERCTGPYIKYQFHDAAEAYVSPCVEHARTLRFNSYNVILLGVLNRSRLKEYLRGPPLQIEVHDRDSKNSLKRKKGSIFGEKEEDKNISSYLPAVKSKESPCSFGVADFDLSELLNGEKLLHLISPIRANHNPKKASRNLGCISVIPSGDYMEFGSELQIKVELARSLCLERLLSTGEVDSSNTSVVQDNSVEECPFGRMVFIFDFANKAFSERILAFVADVNARSLQLDSYPNHLRSEALSSYKLNSEQLEDHSLDIITGYQVFDGKYFIFVLEGLASKGIKLLWESIDHPEYDEDAFFRLMYNSSMTFTKRVYRSADVNIARIKLHTSIATIVQQPLLYVRDTVPRPAFLAITNLYQLCSCVSMQAAVRNRLLLTAEMVQGLNKEFGVPVQPSDIALDHETSAVSSLKHQSSPGATPVVETRHVTIKLPLDTFNCEFENHLQHRKNQAPVDHVCANVKSVLTLSRGKEKNVETFSDDVPVAYNYSSQKLNSIQQAKEALREHLAKVDSKGRYTYCQKYNSASLDHRNVEQETKQAEMRSVEKWKTANGFQVPGVKSSEESNRSSNPVPESRKEELKAPWRENILHANKEPTVERLSIPWEKDFDALTGPPFKFFANDLPVSILSTGETQLQEVESAIRKEQQRWREKILVDHTDFKTHRCLIATELTDRGSKANNQISKLEDILKDPARKKSLAVPGLRARPVVSVMTASNDDNNVGFHPGDGVGSWSRDVNAIPINNYEHTRFEGSKGHDFRLSHTDTEKVNMKIAPLSAAETNLFR